MLRLGTAGPWLLSLLCGLACGDRVVVARGLSLVSAAQSSDDAGFAALGSDGREPEAADAGPDAADAGAEKPFDFGHQGPARRPPPSAPAAHAAREKEPDEGSKLEKPAKPSRPDESPDAGHASDLDHH